MILGGTPASRKVTFANAIKGMSSTSLADTADLLYEAELNTIAELQSQIADATIGITGTLTNTKWCTTNGTTISCTQDTPAGAGDLLANGTVPLTADWDVGSYDITAVEFKGNLVGSSAILNSIDGSGAVDLDYGSADITDHTFTTDGGAVILDGNVNAALTLESEAGGVIVGDGTDKNEDLITKDRASNPDAVYSWDETNDLHFFETFGIITDGNIYSEGGKLIDGDSHYRFTIIDPATAYASATGICVVPSLERAITVTKLEVTLDADPATEPTGDLKYADAFIGRNNSTVINTFDTTNGTLSDDTITSGSVASGKAVYVQFDTTPDSNIESMTFDVTYY